MEPVAFGKYLLVERIAQGGMAEVFRAIVQGPAGVEKTVALKRILPQLGGAAEFTQMFIDEARIASSLTHVNVAQVFEFGEVAGAYYLAMELIEGVDLGRLSEAARRSGIRLPVAVSAFIIAEAARGLQYAHEKRGAQGTPLGIVHRDVSPQNVLVSYAGEVKIADFGIAKAINKLHKTESGAVMGKLRYMSPEQVLGEPLDGRSDLFSLGVVFHELCTGRMLFDGDNPGRVADQVKAAEAAAPSSVQAGVPAELDRICGKLLQRSRDARYERASELARDLQRFVAETAPGLSREDVGALVGELVPRREPSEGDATFAALAPTMAPGETPSLSRDPPPSSQPTRPERGTEAARGTAPAAPAPRTSRAPVVALLVVVAGGAAVLGYRSVHAPQPRIEWLDGGGAVAQANPDLTAAPPSLPALPEAERAKLLAELKALPRESSTRRGVPADDYLAVMSAVDAVLCAGKPEPEFPPDVAERLEPLRLQPEARALARYTILAGELPPEVGGAFRAFLAKQPAWSPGPKTWAMGALAAQVDPRNPAHLVDLMRENTALRRWRDRAAFAVAPVGSAALCDRQELVGRYRQRAPGARADALQRWLAAAPPDASVDHDGLRVTLIGAERDDAAATLDVRLRVTNPAAEERTLAFEGLRLAGLDAAPTIDPPAPKLPGGLFREVRLRFSGITDTVAEAAVLVLHPSAELQAYSELLR
jgi:serine/threonine-protein kinase